MKLKCLFEKLIKLIKYGRFEAWICRMGCTSFQGKYTHEIEVFQFIDSTRPKDQDIINESPEEHNGIKTRSLQSLYLIRCKVSKIDLVACVCVCMSKSSMTLLFKYLAPLQMHCLMTSRCMQFTFRDQRGVYLLGESALPVTEKEGKGERNMSIGPRMKYGQARHILFCPQTNERCCVFDLLILFFCNCQLYKFVSIFLYHSCFL